LRRPAASPSSLFPYTTLFRSAGDIRLPHDVRVSVRRRTPSLRRTLRASLDHSMHLQGRRALHAFQDPLSLLCVHVDPEGRETAIDRKSTRLNSSHSQTSYAVF